MTYSLPVILNYTSLFTYANEVTDGVFGLLSLITFTIVLFMGLINRGWKMEVAAPSSLLVAFIISLLLRILFIVSDMTVISLGVIFAISLILLGRKD